MKIALCDDNKEEQASIIDVLERYATQRGIRMAVSAYDQGEAFLNDFKKGLIDVDLVILDICMDGLSGMDVARAIRTEDTRLPLVFVTIALDYAVDSYEVKASGYLVKPLDEAKFATLLDDVLLAPAPPRLALRVGSVQRYFDYREITYVESRDHAVILHTADGGLHKGYEKLDTIQELLDDSCFLRCHRSYIVNMDFVSDVNRDFILQDGVRVPVRVKERKKMADAYYQYFVDRVCARDIVR